MLQRSNQLRFLVLSLVSLLVASVGHAQILFDAETGVVFPGSYNDIRQPSPAGTLYNAFGPDFNVKPVINLRGRLGYTFNDRHTIYATVAPLLIESIGKQPLTQSVRFDAITVPAGRTLTTRYKFNGYRLTYRYHLIRRETFRLAVGLTGNVRDAFIEVQDGQQSRRFSDLGIVPLLSLYVNYQPGRFGLLLDGDGFASPFGRAEDVFAGVTYALRPKTKLRVGYRILEGGANTDDFYNFTLFNTAAIGIQIGL
ncbi:hypothetical protein [Spirosoma sp. KUDC1026]|uniref:hypothetical protein n=1 Tax=Spirosoma sp. KUDC1026 TaxID=2745947 RepID=UPI00159B9349|nr:hypothetical protein [Spirosoma sp. KUDC1026]QKZ12743.1 hypothetical protein HU175_08905 [Spirosoma sp. KUDC1026]